MTVSCHVCRYSKTLAGNSRPQNQKKATSQRSHFIDRRLARDLEQEAKEGQ